MQRQQQKQQGFRIDLANMKVEIVKRIGVERSRRYFYYLSRLLSQKLSKNEFDKLCTLVIGKENLSLHNQLVRSILKNACDGKVPPSIHEAGIAAKSVVDGLKQSSYGGLGQSVPWSNRVVSPKKSRTTIREQKLKNRPGLVGSNSKLECASHLASASNKCNEKMILENGDITPYDYDRPVQLLQGFAEPPLGEKKIHRFQMSLEIDDALYGNVLSRFPLNAPLGIPFCKYSTDGSQKPIPAGNISNGSISCSGSGTLPDTESLQKCMEQIAVAQGLEGVTTESVNILNSGLNVYLKRLITSCVSVVGGKSGIGLAKQVSQKQQIQGKLLNGFLLSNHQYMQNNGSPSKTLAVHRSFYSMSMLDFKVAMELNPQQLGEDWPLYLEKINMDQFP